MSNKHHFTLECIPTPQERVRHAVRNGISMAYKSTKQKDREKELDALLAPYAPVAPKTHPIAIYIKCYMPIPKSATKAFKAACEDEHTPYVGKKDLDNMTKNLLDACTRLGFWIDDAQVAVLSAAKMYSPRPRWEVEYYEIVG